MSHQKEQVAESMHVPHDQLPPRSPQSPQSPQQQLEAARLPQLPCSSLLGLGPSKRFGSQLVSTFYGKHPEGLSLFTPPFFFSPVPLLYPYRADRTTAGNVCLGACWPLEAPPSGTACVLIIAFSDCHRTAYGSSSVGKRSEHV
jgi:hypothetical protein